jgi:hypothetical protein
MIWDTPRFVPLTLELLEWALAEREAASPEACAYRQPGHVLEQALRPPHRGEALLGRGRVLAAAGLTVHWAGRAECWMLVSPFATRADRVRAVRRCRRTLDEMQADPMFRRLEMAVLESAPWRDSFAVALGFIAEATVRAWDPLGRDHVLYARIQGAG